MNRQRQQRGGRSAAHNRFVIETGPPVMTTQEKRHKLRILLEELKDTLQAPSARHEVDWITKENKSMFFAAWLVICRILDSPHITTPREVLEALPFFNILSPPRPPPPPPPPPPPAPTPAPAQVREVGIQVSPPPVTMCCVGVQVSPVPPLTQAGSTQTDPPAPVEPAKKKKKGKPTVDDTTKTRVKAVVLHGVSTQSTLVKIRELASLKFTSRIAGVRWLVNRERRAGKKKSSVVVYFDAWEKFKDYVVHSGRKLKCSVYEWERRVREADEEDEESKKGKERGRAEGSGRDEMDMTV